jgi:hypothetical protein
VWLNGQSVYSGTHADNYAAELIPLQFKEGANTLLLKTNNTENENWSAWCLSLCLCQADGRPAEGLPYDPFPGLPESLLLKRSPPLGEPPFVQTRRDTPGNLARGKPVTGDRELRWSTSLPSSARQGDPGQLLVDGDVHPANHVWTQGDGKPSWVQIDLGEPRQVSRVVLWHYVGRTYHHNRLALSETGEFAGEEKVVFDSDQDGEYEEAAEGREIRFEKTRARYLRSWLCGAGDPGGKDPPHFADNLWVEVEVYE